MLGARALSIKEGSNPEYRSWKSVPTTHEIIQNVFNKWSRKIRSREQKNFFEDSIPANWSPDPFPKSRFPECAVLTRKVCRLDIKGKIHISLLSPNTYLWHIFCV
ncbi:hypothetical protein RND81_02G023600 [Saponaria officinalis]|uniref:Uncharacterized protein n=1 Tax=Saponaria officinalis TaxID=3572 RepID=A0AAW1MQ78_SAPOF